MPYLTQSVIEKAYRSLAGLTDGSGKKPTEVTSALRYLIATSAMLKKLDATFLDLSVKNRLNRSDFIEEVGKVVSLSNNFYYTNNFIDEIKTGHDFATSNNFLTTRLKIDGLYPGRPAGLLNITQEQIRILSDVKQILETTYNLNQLRVPLVLWLMRETDINPISIPLDDNRLTKAINIELSAKYENLVWNSLRLDSNDVTAWLHLNNIDISNVLQATLSLTDFLVPTSQSFSGSILPSTMSEWKGDNKIYYGSPGTGKSTRAHEIISGFENIVTTFHPDLDYAGFVGSYKPVKKGKDISYEFVPRSFADAYVKAWQTQAPFYLVIEEINRGNCAAIFGDIFQLLDRDDRGYSRYFINAEPDLANYLEERLKTTDYASRISKLYKEKMNIDCKEPFRVLLIPSNLIILATMNTSDQSLFPMDSAFKRRWKWEYVPIDLDDAYKINVNLTDYEMFNWGDFIEKINNKIFDLTKSEDKKLGNRFVSTVKGENVTVEEFKTKVMFYLWNDIYKEEVGTPVTIFKSLDAQSNIVEFSYGDLFAGDSEEIIRNFLEVNGVKILPKL